MIERFVDEKNAHCDPKTRDCTNCNMKDRCLILQIMLASTVQDLHLEPIDGRNPKIIRNGEIKDG